MYTEEEKKIIKKKVLKTMKGKGFLKGKIAERVSESELEEIWKDAHKRLAKMYADHMDLPDGVKTHTDGFIFPAAAVYLSLKKVKPDIAYDIMKTAMAEKSQEEGRKFAKYMKIPGFAKFFLGMWDPISHKMFGESSGFKNVFYPKEKNCYKMDIIECPYHKYLSEQGCPELNILFCDNDVYMYGNLPKLKFTRTQTIGAGGELCDFKMEFVKDKKQ